MLSLAVTMLLAVSSVGYGLFILHRLSTVPSGRFERLLFAVLLGAGVLTFSVLGVGLLGGLSVTFAVILLVPGVLLSVLHARHVSPRGLRSTFRKGLSTFRKGLSTFRTGGVVVWGCWLFLLVSGGLNLLAALAPVSGTDVLAYHLAIPKLYVEEGRIRYVPGVYYATAPFGLEMLFTLALLLGSPIAAQVTHFGFGVVSAGIVSVLGARAMSPRAGLLGATLFYAVTDVSVQSSIALIDLGAAAYLLAGILAALRWREQGGRWFLVAAILAGLHAGTKMPNLSAAGALWLMMAVDVVWRRELRLTWRPLFISGVVMVLLAAPWFARSWAWTGNPVYPYLNGYFHGRDFSPEASERQLALQYYKTIGDRSIDRLLFAPAILTVIPDAFRSGYLGPLYLSFLPFLFLAPVGRGARLLLLFALLAFPTWFFIYPRLRTLLPLVGALSGLAGGAMLGVARLHPAIRGLTIGVTVLWLLTALAANARYHLPAVPVALGLESEDAFLRRRLPQPDSKFLWYDDFMALNTMLPEQAVVLLWDTRGYYLERHYIWANSVAQGLIPPARQHDPDELIRALRERGVTHVAMHPGEAPAGSEVPIERLQYNLQVSGALREIYRSQTMSLSELTP